MRSTHFGTPTGPSHAHNHLSASTRWVATSSARVLYGARVSLVVAIVATALSMIIGVVSGMIAGFYRGWPDYR